MPRRDPFTTLCGRIAELAKPRRADLHSHTTASDGEYTPGQVVALARQAKLGAIAITDHDTLAGLPEAIVAAGDAIEVVPGVEISTHFDGREFHLLGYFIRSDDRPLNIVLQAVCQSRRERFRDFLAQLQKRGFVVPPDRAALVEQRTSSLGRRHIAGLLVACGHARSRTEAFHRLMNPLAREVQAKSLVPLAEAIRLVHAAGGVASLAHPPADMTNDTLEELRGFGLDALEVVYPWGRSSPAVRLREAATRFGLAISGGSDCHGADPVRRRIGSCAITSDELAALRERAVRTGSQGPS